MFVGRRFCSSCSSLSLRGATRLATIRRRSSTWVHRSEADLVTELTQRGLFHSLVNHESGSHLQGGSRSVYAGFDPTADSLHIGHLLTLLTLMHFARHGHKPVVVLGGFTAILGDPTGRSTARSKLEMEAAKKNADAIEKQIRKVFSNCGFPEVLIRNNLDWWYPQRVYEFFTQVAAHVRVGHLLSRDTVKTRLDGPEGMAFSELLYPLLQGHDFLHLNEHDNVTVQIGGSDQTVNILVGIELEKKLRNKGLFGLTVNLLETAGGEKIGKSAGNAIWLDEGKTSAYELYQFFLRCEDVDVEKYLKSLTLLSMDEIKDIVEEHKTDKAKRKGQRKIAEAVTTIVHGKSALERAQRASELLFPGKASDKTRVISLEDIDALPPGVPTRSYANASELIGRLVVDVAAEVGATKDPAKARLLVKNRGLYVNNQPVETESQTIHESDLLGGAALIIRTGKNNYFILRIHT